MAEVQRTLAIVKPDATARPGVAGQILARIEEAGLRIGLHDRQGPLHLGHGAYSSCLLGSLWVRWIRGSAG